MAANRGQAPQAQTVQLLCAKAAGRCEFEGCGKILYEEILTRKGIRDSVVAHIVASSPDGPRGDPNRSHALSAEISNLMLLCPTHHKLIDDNADEYPETRLKAMKQAHEDSVERACAYLQAKPSEMISLISPIKGCNRVSLDPQKQAQALLPEHFAATMPGQVLYEESHHPYRSRDYWCDVEKQLMFNYERYIGPALRTNLDQHYSVFAIAPMPLIIKLGAVLGDKSSWPVYQFFRESESWCWPTQEQTNQFVMCPHQRRQGNRVALVLSLTADIALERVEAVFDADTIITVRATRFGVDCIRSPKDLVEFWHCYQNACDYVKNNIIGVEEIAVFPAMPTSAAFEVGRRYMSGVYPRLKIYDADNGFFETLTIGGVN